jgi:SAM-dependent methyltransferase
MDDSASPAYKHARRLVASGYDTLGPRYLEWAAQIRGDPRVAWLEDLMRRIPRGARVLDLGCGAGLPSTQRLVERFRVVGVDISPRQLSLAKQLLQGVMLVRADMAELGFADRSFAAITALYSVIHVPRCKQPELFSAIRRWLRPGGFVLASLSAHDSPDIIEGDFVGVPMFFSGFEPARNLRLLTEAGLTVEHDQVITMHEPEGETPFHWVLASTPTE